MKTQKIIAIPLLLATLLMSACSAAPATPTAAPTVDLTALVTQVAQTLEVRYTQTAAAKPVEPTAAPTATLLPTAMSQATATSFNLPTQAPTATATALVSTTSGGSAAAPAAPAALFAVTSVITSVNNAGMSAACPPGYTFYFSATITANGPGNVTYDWEFSDGRKSDKQTLEYTAAGSKVVTASWELGNSGEVAVGETYKGWARITIDDPNHQVFPRAGFSMSCTP